VAEPAPIPLGFGKCAACPYRESGTPRICYDCARLTVQPLDARRCLVCDQTLPEVGTCGNRVCGWKVERTFGRCWAIALKSGELEDAIHAFKYQDVKLWARIFARVLLGFLGEHRAELGGYDWIVASQAYRGEGARRTWHPARLILEEAAKLDEIGWPFDLNDPQLIVKTGETPKMVDAGTWKNRR